MDAVKSFKKKLELLIKLWLKIAKKFKTFDIYKMLS